MFEVGELAILNEKVGKGLPQHVGDLVPILRKIKSSNYDYDVELANGDINPVKESELNKLNNKQLQQVSYIKRGNTVIHSPSDEKVRIMKVDYLHSQAEIDFLSGGSTVVGFETLRKLNEESVSVEESDDIHENLLNTFFKHYKNQDDTYTVPKELLLNMLNQMYTE